MTMTRSVLMTRTVLMPGTVLLNECYKRIILLWSYRFNFLTETLMIGFLFVGISFFVSGGSPAPEQMAPALLGYLTWFFAAFAIGDMSQGIREETQTGTLEQMYMSPLPSGLLLAGRSVASLLVSSAMVILVGGILMLLLGIRIPVRLEGAPIFILTITGLYGFAFLLGGATLVFKQVNALSNLMTNMLLFLNGSFLTVERMPVWLETFARSLPTTQGIDVLRRVVLDDLSLTSVWQDGSLVWLIAHSAIFLIVGWGVFLWGERVARRRGLLGQY